MELPSSSRTTVTATGATQEENPESRDVPFPFLELPPELCLRIVKHLARLIALSYYSAQLEKNGWENALVFASQNPKRSCYGDLRLLCKAVNDLIEKNRGTLGGLRAKRLIIGQHSSFDRCPRRFLVPEPGKLPDCLDSCALGYVEQVFFYMVKIETIALGHIVSKLRRNRINVTAMIFYGVEFACEASSLVDLFDVSVTKCVVRMSTLY
ncbi:unnamed protein product [Cylicocyclus nassatus]|uniref:Uncharacterized protein n=1 Tax=Cylicocyclus nassatus TaxID=53992 RepID=A0AA36M0Q1_CYLNA|nr:unnamed protein product [Cylicocyclus nassatus]